MPHAPLVVADSLMGCCILCCLHCVSHRDREACRPEHRDLCNGNISMVHQDIVLCGSYIVFSIAKHNTVLRVDVEVFADACQGSAFIRVRIVQLQDEWDGSGEA